MGNIPSKTFPNVFYQDHLPTKTHFRLKKKLPTGAKPQKNHSKSRPRTNQKVKGSVRYAHRAVQQAFIIVRRLVNEWNNREVHRRGSREPSLDNIEKLVLRVGQTSAGMDQKRSADIFCSFVSAALYARAIRYSYENKLKDLRIEPGSDSVMSLSYVNDLAEKALKCLREALPTGGRLRHMSGNLAILRSEGSIPFLQVLTSKTKTVALRRGFELQKSKNPETQKVLGPDHALKDLPCRVYLNGCIQTGLLRKETLKDVFEDPEYVNRVLTNKYISWIHVSLPDNLNKKTHYEIDFIDHRIESDPAKTFIPKRKLEAYAGRRRYGWKKENTSFSQEDIFVSFLSNILFTQSKDRKAKEQNEDVSYWQELENWSRDRIINFATEKNRRSKTYPMYVGYSYSTILDGGYADQALVNGSTNVLLMALTRGMVRLMLNNDKIVGFLDVQRGGGRRPEGVTLIERRRQKTGQFLGATASGITVRSQWPWKLYGLLGVATVLFAVYATLVGRVYEDPEEFFSSLFSLFSFLTGTALLLAKYLYKSWEVSGMLYRYRNSRRMSELVAVLPNGKRDAIEIFGLMDNPERVFSDWRSCAFAEQGRGDFEIDDKITVRDLEGAGFVFGVDYDGEPVVVNCRGIVREMDFPVGLDPSGLGQEEDWRAEFDSERLFSGGKADEPFLHVGKRHKLTLGVIFQLPVIDLIVGSNSRPGTDRNV